MTEDPAPPGAFVRRNAVALGVVFAAFLALGVLRDNWAALAGGAGGLIWLAWHRLKQR
ncbi:MAG: hypothetical protein AAGI34_11700 [Pseudomonadota bacterium]